VLQHQWFTVLTTSIGQGKDLRRNKKLLLKPQQQRRYALLGGAPKSGTTSLFRYISDHPQVCPSMNKETYFFAREFDYKNVCKQDISLDGFRSYFENCRNTRLLRFEGTPYTLYSKNAVEDISDLLPDVKIVFILRDPIDRLVSEFQFHLQRGHEAARDNFKEFLHAQLSMRSKVPNLIELGFYIKYLDRFLSEFGLEKVIVLIFEDFICNLHDQMQYLCTALGIDPHFYSRYKFRIHNQTLTPRSRLLEKIKISSETKLWSLRYSLRRYPLLLRVFNRNVSFMGRLFRRVNTKKHDLKPVITPDTHSWLLETYQPYNLMLEKLLGRNLPWSSNRTAS
jgi:hypothetical protein